MALTSVDSPRPSPRWSSNPTRSLGYTRSASDVLRVLVYGTLAVVVLLVTRCAEDAVLGFEQDVVAALGFLEPPAERILEGVAELVAAVAGIAVLVFPFVLRRYRMFWYLVAANIVSSLLVAPALAWLDHDEPRQVANELAQRSGVQLGGALSASSMAALAASFVILAPFVGSRWRRAGALLLAALVVLRIVLSVELPAEIFLALAIGAASGAATLLAFGRPDQHPSLRAVAASLGAAGLVASDLGPSPVSRHGSRNFLVTLTDGGQVLAKVRSPAERSADLLYRFYRYLRLKNVGDERPFISLRRAVEHEALASLPGARHRRPDAASPRHRRGRDRLDAARVRPRRRAHARRSRRCRDRRRAAPVAMGADRRPRARRIAHRDLRRSNVVIDASGAPWIVDFGFVEVAVADSLLDADVAQLLAALTLQVGPERAVDSAISVVGMDAVRSSLPLLQLNALSGSTRGALRQRKGLLKELQTTVAQRCAVEQPEFTPLARLDRRAILTIVMLVLVVYFLLPQFSNLPGIVDQVKEANWIWFVPVAAGVGLDVPRRDVRHAGIGAGATPVRAHVRRPGRVVVRRHAGAGIGRRHGTQRAVPAEVGRRSRGRRTRGRAQRGGRHRDAHPAAHVVHRVGRNVRVRVDAPARPHGAPVRRGRGPGPWRSSRLPSPRSAASCASAWCRSSSARPADSSRWCGDPPTSPCCSAVRSW